MSKSTTFVPNSFQTPNEYVDHVMPYLTGEEYKVLLYATRRILGFQKRQDRISLSQFTDGTKSRKGRVLDRGTGLSVETVKKCLASLVSFGLMVRVAENDPKRNEGTLWSLQWNGRKVNWKGLDERAQLKFDAESKKMEKARSMRQTPPNGIEGGPPNGIEDGPPNGIETQYPEETQGNPELEEEERVALENRIFILSGLYKQNIGSITPLVKDFLRNAAISYPDQSWYRPAFEITMQNAEHKSWTYVETVLSNWREHGFGWRPERANGRQKSARKRQPAEENRNKYVEGQYAQFVEH